MPFPQPPYRRGFRAALGLATVSIFLALMVPRAGASNFPLTCNPSGLSFGNVQVGGSRTLSAALTNTGASSITLSREATTGDGFSVSGLAFPLTLEAGQSFTFSVSFAPQSAGSVVGSLMTTGPGNSVLTIPLTGAGTGGGELVTSPTTMSFGNVTVGKKAWQTGELTAIGAEVTVYSVSANGSEFTILGPSFPLTVAPGQSVPFSVAFHPQDIGKAGALVSFHSNASRSRALEGVDGNGVAPQSYTVSLNWQPSTSQVVGYNVYRGTKYGGPYSQINSALDPDTNFIDNNVPGGQIYYYVTTAVNSAGQESGYSNQAQANVP